MTKHYIARILDEQLLRQDWLARRMGISEAYLSRLLSGERRWTDELKDKAAQALGRPRAELFFESEY